MSVHPAAHVPFVDRRSAPARRQHWIERVSQLRRAFSHEQAGSAVERRALDAYFIHALGAHLARRSAAPEWSSLDAFAFVAEIQRTPTWRAHFRAPLLATLLAFYAFLFRRQLIDGRCRARITRQLQIMLCRWIL